MIEVENLVKKEMLLQDATELEADAAYSLYQLLQPGLKIKKNKRVNTAYGDKSFLGLYRTIKREIMRDEWQKKETSAEPTSTVRTS